MLKDRRQLCMQNGKLTDQTAQCRYFLEDTSEVYVLTDRSKRTSLGFQNVRILFKILDELRVGLKLDDLQDGHSMRSIICVCASLVRCPKKDDSFGAVIYSSPCFVLLVVKHLSRSNESLTAFSVCILLFVRCSERELPV